MPHEQAGSAQQNQTLTLAQVINAGALVSTSEHHGYRVEVIASAGREQWFRFRIASTQSAPFTGVYTCAESYPEPYLAQSAANILIDDLINEERTDLVCQWFAGQFGNAAAVVAQASQAVQQEGVSRAIGCVFDSLQGPSVIDITDRLSARPAVADNSDPFELMGRGEVEEWILDNDPDFLKSGPHTFQALVARAREIVAGKAALEDARR